MERDSLENDIITVLINFIGVIHGFGDVTGKSLHY